MKSKRKKHDLPKARTTRNKKARPKRVRQVRSRAKTRVSKTKLVSKNSLASKRSSRFSDRKGVKTRSKTTDRIKSKSIPIKRAVKVSETQRAAGPTRAHKITTENIKGYSSEKVAFWKTVVHLPKTTLNKKIDLITNSLLPEVDKNITRNKNIKRGVKGGGYNPPKGLFVTVVTSKGKKTFARGIKKTPPDFVVNKRNLKAYLVGILRAHADDYTEHLEDNDGEKTASDWVFNPNNVSRLDIKFLY